MKKQSKLTAEQKNQCFNEDFNRLASLFSERITACKANADKAHQCNSMLLQSIDELYLNLMEYQQFHDTIDAANSCSPLENQPWNYYPLSSTALLQVGLITLFRFIPIPLHDHPGAYGALRILSGKVHIQQYQHSTDTNQQQSIVSLKRVASHNLSRDGNAAFQPDTGNLHDIKSLSRHSVLLSMMIHPYQPQERSWYFPMHFPGMGKERLYNRVQRRAFSNGIKL